MFCGRRLRHTGGVFLGQEYVGFRGFSIFSIQTLISVRSGIIEVIGGSLTRKRVGRRATQVVGYKKYTNCLFLHSEQVAT